MDTTDKVLMLEISKLLLNGYFAFAKQKGLDEQEVETMYRESKEQFEKNNPGNLEDV